MIKDFLKLAIENITLRKLRSWLTILGIVIGIAAVVALVSLGQGLQYTVDQQFKKIGSDLLVVQVKGVAGAPGSDSGNNILTIKDFDAVKRTIGVKQVMERLSKTGKVEFNKKTKFLMVQGLPTDDSLNIILETGQKDIEERR